MFYIFQCETSFLCILSSSQVMISWYRISTESPHNRRALLKVGLLFDWFQRHHMEPITDDLSLCKQNMFFVKLYIHSALIEKIVLIGNNFTSRASLSPTFRLWLVSDRVEVRYHYTLTCEDDILHTKSLC